MASQIIKISLSGEKTIQKIKPIDVTKARISFMDYSDPNFRVWFEDSENIVIEGGSGEIVLKIFEG